MGEPTAAPALVAHPWNRSFQWRDHQGPLRRLRPDQAEAFDRDGYVVLESVVDADTVAAVTEALDVFEERVDHLLQQLDGQRLSVAESGALTVAPNVAALSPVLAAFAAHPVFADLCHDLIGPDARLYWEQAVYKKTEKPRRVPFHQDNGYAYVEPQQYLTCWVPLVDVDEANGCPWLVPGVHRQGTLQHRWVDPLGHECFEDHPAKLAAPCPAGSVVVFSSLTPHLTGPNTSDGVRKAYILQYCPDGVAVLEGDPEAGPPLAERPCTDPVQNPWIVRDGVAVGPST
jgi:ectoine hydroxylase-related dioxygenase (phytanoyl-CoA dioxygenase family)